MVWLSDLLLLLLLLFPSTSRGEYDVLAEWTTVKFDFSSPEEEAEAIESGAYVPENCFLTGIKVKGYFFYY